MDVLQLFTQVVLNSSVLLKSTDGDVVRFKCTL